MNLHESLDQQGSQASERARPPVLKAVSQRNSRCSTILEWLQRSRNSSLVDTSCTSCFRCSGRKPNMSSTICLALSLCVQHVLSSLTCHPACQTRVERDSTKGFHGSPRLHQVFFFVFVDLAACPSPALLQLILAYPFCIASHLMLSVRRQDDTNGSQCFIADTSCLTPLICKWTFSIPPVVPLRVLFFAGAAAPAARLDLQHLSSCRLEPHGYSRLPHKHSSRVLDTGTVMDLDMDLNPNTVMDLE